MTISKPLLLFGLPRSGTSLFFSVINQYLHETQGILSLGEYFNPDGLMYTYQNNVIRMVLPAFPAKNPEPEVRQRIFQKKFEYLKEAPEKYFMKVHPIFGTPEIIEWLHQTYDWIHVERRDLFQHFLSFALSVQTDRWYEKGGLNIAPGSVFFKPHLVQDFEGQLQTRDSWKQRQRPHTTLIYEDFADAPPTVLPHLILKKLGFQTPQNTEYVLSEKQNPESKLHLFKEPDVVLRAYQNSPLNERFPVPILIEKNAVTF